MRIAIHLMKSDRHILGWRAEKLWARLLLIMNKISTSQESKTKSNCSHFIALLLAISVFGGPLNGVTQERAIDLTSKVVLASEVKWSALNPARGNKGPQAGNLWGDRTGSGPSGFLVKFVDGFSSPPHIHNVTYRGIVISGLVHNDDPDAKAMWMPTGSFWTQPSGEAHITAARGSTNLIYVEIEKGPYLVRPVEEAIDTGERPVNVHEANIVWLDASTTTWINEQTTGVPANGPKIAFLWGNPQDDQPSGALIKLPARFTGKIRNHRSTFRAVVIQGRPNHRAPGQTTTRTLEPGSYFSSSGDSAHQISTQADGECIIYVRTEGKFDVIPLGN